ncbi:MAG: hypothetical protein J6K65_07390 [Alphaproteobacteria bacterium]|nr:hypothetical protein [Alphaproteobacteria bacterium]
MIVKKMFKTAVLAVFCGAIAFPAVSRAAAFYLYYNINSPHLDEIGVDGSEVAKVFDDEFGPASEELPSEVKITDFFVAKYPDQSYVFMLNAPFNCGQLGCNTRVYRRDADGDLMLEESSFPVKCKYYESDKLLCIKGGYKVEKPKPAPKKGPVHYPAPRGSY